MVDGLALGCFGPFHSTGQDEVRVFRSSTYFPHPPRSVRIENVIREGWSPVLLRVKHILVRVPSSPLPFVVHRVRRLVTLLRDRLGRPTKLNG